MSSTNGKQFLKTAVLQPRLMRVWSSEGVGKTSLAAQVTAPEAEDPYLMHYFNWDHGLERAHKALTKRGHLEAFNIYTYSWPRTGNVEEEDALAMLSTWEDNWITALESCEENNGGVLVLDTETHWTEIATIVKTNAALRQRMAKRTKEKFGAANEVQRLDYGPRNAYIERTILSVREIPNTYLVAISRVADEYQGNQPTGKKIPKGYRDLGSMVDFGVSIRRLKEGARVYTVEQDKFHDENVGAEFEDVTWDELRAELWG